MAINDTAEDVALGENCFNDKQRIQRIKDLVTQVFTDHYQGLFSKMWFLE